jgi:hypothetical protein
MMGGRGAQIPPGRLPLLSLKTAIERDINHTVKVFSDLRRENTRMPQICLRSADFGKIRACIFVGTFMHF